MELKSRLERTANWNKYQPKATIQAPNPYLYYLIELSFQGVNRIFVLSFENTTNRTVHTKSYLLTVEIKDYDVMLDEKIFFYQQVKIDLEHMITFEKLRVVKEMITRLVVC